MEFNQFHKIYRLNRDFQITEKIDGTNASILWSATERHEEFALGEFDGRWLYAASRTRWITPDSDNHGFARWVRDHAEDLAGLGAGRHFGEWYGAGINRGYGLKEKRLALFDQRWTDPYLRPECCEVVPTLATVNGYELGNRALCILDDLRDIGSVLVPGFMQPEGIVIQHSQAGTRFKALCYNDDIAKSAADVVVLHPVTDNAVDFAAIAA